MRDLTKDELRIIIDVVVDQYLSIIGAEEDEIIQALVDETDLTEEEILENFSILDVNFDD